MKLTEEQIEEYSKGWNIRVNQVVATRFLKDLETTECTYIQADSEKSWKLTERLRVRPFNTSMDYVFPWKLLLPWNIFLKSYISQK